MIYKYLPSATSNYRKEHFITIAITLTMICRGGNAPASYSAPL